MRTRSDTDLSSRIESGKAHARIVEAEITQMDSRLDSLTSRIRRYKRELEGYEKEARSGLSVNQNSYEEVLANHNRLVEQYNALLARRNSKYKQYEQEIDSVNDMVSRYNRGER
jgi:chromosome segregation ATPase